MLGEELSSERSAARDAPTTPCHGSEESGSLARPSTTALTSSARRYDQS
ncbi:hypothetical protein ACWERW_22170 [Streptomyces sp. NPDC004012]